MAEPATGLDGAGRGGRHRRHRLRASSRWRARAGRAQPQSRFCDINADMLGEGRRRAEEKGETAIEWVCGDAESLPFPDAAFDAYTIAFGIRNVTHIDQRAAPKRGGC